MAVLVFRDDLDRRAPGWGSPTSASLVRAYMAGAWRAAALALPPHVPLVASEHNQMSWPAGDHTPRARDAARRLDLFLTPRAVGPRLGGADRPGRRPAARRALIGGRPVLRGAAGIRLAAADPRRPAPRRQGTRSAHRDTRLIDAPLPAYLVGDGPLRGPLTRLIRARGWKLSCICRDGPMSRPATSQRPPCTSSPHARSRGRKAPCRPWGSASRSSAPRSTAWRAPWARAAASWCRPRPPAASPGRCRASWPASAPTPPSAGPAPAVHPSAAAAVQASAHRQLLASRARAGKPGAPWP
jgi:hypothetical protein